MYRVAKPQRVPARPPSVLRPVARFGVTTLLLFRIMRIALVLLALFSVALMAALMLLD
ncbi:hypothetical protein LKO27_00650 [Tessaracoccus sp. OS52]|uniref:hypothetical protein n=1 Tax=Tessaracoccus sp. OS52 TaxID=2886691 RepID=UPI001D117894|nr:hypothetical protein [Tessaracoccus sp. OS52]MCC2591940.1 hypothetical protein [Tessaracoccus sp. OS52]